MAPSSAPVYGWIGFVYSSSAGETSISLPRYITAIRSDTWRTTRQVVGHEQVGEPELVLEVVEQVDDLRLHRDVERGHRLVEHDQARLERQRASDADALALAAGELVRVAVDVLGVEPHALEQLAHAVARRSCPVDAVQPQRQADDLARPACAG